MNASVMNNSVNATIVSNSVNATIFGQSAILSALKSNLHQLGDRIMQSRLLVCLGLVFSIILGEDVTPLRALRLLNAMVSGLCAFLFGGFGIGIQLLLLAWFALSVWTLTHARY